MTVRVLIAGGGIAGLTTALACLKAGLDVQLFEQASEFSEVGAGIQIGPNAARVMRAIGVEEQLDRCASFPEYQELRLGQYNMSISRTPLGASAVERYGAPYYLLHRCDLLDVLSNTLIQRAPDVMRMSTAATGYRNTATGAALIFADGSEAEGDVVIAADGIHSVLAGQMLGVRKPRFTGNVVWRAMVPATERLKAIVPNSMCVWVGPERHCVTYWLRNRTVLNFVGAVERDDWTSESWTESGPKEEFVRDFGNWCKPLAATVEAAGECLRWALFDRDPFPQWTDGHVALIGDACHPMLPFLAQGAAMGIEDAWVIAQSVATMSNDVPGALKRYEDLRKPRTSRVQAAARARMTSNHQSTLAGQMKTYAPMWASARLSPGKFARRNDWLFGHDVITEAEQFMEMN